MSFILIKNEIRNINKEGNIIYGKIYFSISYLFGLFKKIIECKYEYSLEKSRFIFIKGLYINNVYEKEYFKYSSFEHYINYKKNTLNILNNEYANVLKNRYIKYID